MVPSFIPGETERFSIKLRYWIPTAEMCAQYRAGALLSMARKSIGHLPLRIPRGFSLALPRTRGAVGRAFDNGCRRTWTSLEARFAECERYSPVPTYPDELAGELVPPIFPDSAFRLELRNSHYFYYHIIYRQAEDGGVYARRKVSLEEGERYAYHDLLIADPIRPGAKIADRLLKSAIRFYRKICLARVELDAGLSRGGALWAKFGFRPKTERDWRICAERAGAKLRSLGDAVGMQLQDDVKSILAMRSPRSIWLLSEITDKIQGVKIGDILLSGTSWPGVLDLGDERACQILDTRLRSVQ